jgi:hypothetical protein
MVMVEDKETQQNGRVFVVWGDNQAMERSVTWKMGRLCRALPARFGGVHACMVSESAFMHGSLVAMARFAFETLTRLRLRTHVGKCDRADFSFCVTPFESRDFLISRTFPYRISHRAEVYITRFWNPGFCHTSNK